MLQPNVARRISIPTIHMANMDGQNMDEEIYYGNLLPAQLAAVICPVSGPGLPFLSYRLLKGLNNYPWRGRANNHLKIKIRLIMMNTRSIINSRKQL
ncbi:MAG: hypothetical protein ACRERV_08100 [Methylococcales bacterium]